MIMRLFANIYEVFVLVAAVFLAISPFIVLGSNFGLLGFISGPFVGFISVCFWLSINGYKMD